MQHNSSALSQKPARSSVPTVNLIASAIASQKIEGLELDAQARSDFAEFEMGSLSLPELRSRLVTRYRKAAVAR